MIHLSPLYALIILSLVLILAVFLVLMVRCRRNMVRALAQARNTMNLEKLRTDTILGNLPVGIEIYSKEGILVGINDCACRIFGVVDRQEVIGAASIRENPVIPEELKEAFEQQEEVEAESYYDFSVVRQTGFYKTTCGTAMKRISSKGAPIFDPDGAMQNYVFIMNDITREHEQELQLKENIQLARQAIQAADLVHWRYDNRTHLFTSHNEPLTHYDDNLLVSPADYTQAIHPDDLECIRRYIRMMEEGVDFVDETSVRMKSDYDDDWQDCVVNATPFLRDETGKVVLYTGFRRNVTPTKKLLKELSDAKERAEESDKLKSAFLANISHEIRTPLNAIIGFSSLLMNTDRKEEMDEYKQIIASNTDLLLRLVNDVLDLSKIESGTIDVKLAEFDLAIYFEELCNSIRPLVVRPEVKLVCDNPYKRFMVLLDNNRLAQVMLNYATNAIKCTRQGTIHVGYRCEGEGIRFYVSDTGIGISEANKSRLYQRFEKLNEFAQGTGLGLVICKVVTEASGGQVGFESEEGVGSTFWSWVPCEYKRPEEVEKAAGATTDAASCMSAELNEEEMAMPESMRASAIVSGQQPALPEPVDVPECPGLVREPSPASEKRILIVEDIESNYLLMQILLKGKGYRCYRAADGVEAVEKVLSEHFDLVLMDIKMPRLDGLEATREIRKTNREVPIVALTAHAFNADKELAIAAGCDGYLVKPINEKALNKVLGKYLREPMETSVNNDIVN